MRVETADGSGSLRQHNDLHKMKAVAWHLRSDLFMTAKSETTQLDFIMPVLSKFYGIVIRMMIAHPFAAHFHAIYQDSELVVSIEPLRIIQGDAPGRVRSMVLEWARQHRNELLVSWYRLSAAQKPLPIRPLE